MKIYLAGPLFTVAERDFNARLAHLLREAGFEVWLPQESEQRLMTAKQIFEKDVEGLDWAEVVVANLDGPDPDSGTCWECGYAYRNKPIIIFRTDFRAADEPGKAAVNLMLTESAACYLDVAFKHREKLVPADVEFVATKLIKVLNDLTNADARRRT
jgi:nucleoside 2-deoxyribosyltransferase